MNFNFPATILLALTLAGCGWHELPSGSAAGGAKKGAGRPAATVPWPADFNPPLEIRTEPVKVPEQLRDPSPPLEGTKEK